VRNAEKVIAIEGCFIQCASRMMEGVLDDFKPQVIIADSLYTLRRPVWNRRTSRRTDQRHANMLRFKFPKGLRQWSDSLDGGVVM